MEIERDPANTPKQSKMWVVVSVFLILLLLSTMFVMSSQNGTASHGISESIVGFFRDHLPIAESIKTNPSFEKINFDFLLRKTAHFTEFFLLAALIYFLLLELRYKYRNIFKTTIAVCFVFALMDEFHQIFVMARSPMITDVLIDTAGSVLALSLIYIGTAKKTLKRSLQKGEVQKGDRTKKQIKP